MSKRYTQKEFIQSIKDKASIRWGERLGAYSYNTRYRDIPAYHLIPLIERYEALEAAAKQMLAAEYSFTMDKAFRALEEALKVGEEQGNG